VARTGATRRLRERCAAGCFAAVFFPVALRLAGLRVHNRLRAGSPGKALAPRPGEIAAYSRTTPLAAASSRHASSG
ncbi:hypothetical protein, partial [Klebsiella michiganensis]